MKAKITSFALLFVLLNSSFFILNSEAQWQYCGIPGSNSVRSLAVSGNNIFAGTYEYGVFLSTNNGTNWTQTGLDDKTVHSLVISGNNIFAGTFLEGVYLSTNNGEWWSLKGLINKVVYSLAIS